MKKIIALFTMLVGFSIGAFAQTATESQTANEGFIGYSFVRQHVKAKDDLTSLRFHEDTDSHGFNAAYTRYFGGSATKAGTVGFTADLGANFAHGEANLVTLMGGLTAKARNSKYVQPYVRGLAGFARQNVTRVNITDNSDASFAYALGGGVDFNTGAYSRYKIRLGADYLNTGFNGERQNAVRIITGLTF